jgi:hypothetical protein
VDKAGTLERSQRMESHLFLASRIQLMLIHCMSELEDPVEFMQNWSAMYPLLKLSHLSLSRGLV